MIEASSLGHTSSTHHSASHAINESEWKAMPNCLGIAVDCHDRQALWFQRPDRD